VANAIELRLIACRLWPTGAEVVANGTRAFSRILPDGAQAVGAATNTDKWPPIDCNLDMHKQGLSWTTIFLLIQNSNTQNIKNSVIIRKPCRINSFDGMLPSTNDLKTANHTTP
jgi:hypothetical protein